MRAGAGHIAAVIVKGEQVAPGFLDQLKTISRWYSVYTGDSELRAIEVLDWNFSRKSHTNPTQTKKGLQT
jgi:hypothetical protein